MTKEQEEIMDNTGQIGISMGPSELGMAPLIIGLTMMQQVFDLAMKTNPYFSSR